MTTEPEPTNWFGWDYDDDENQPKPWTLKDIYDDLVTLEEVCRRLNISRTTRMQYWIKRRERIGCPYPIKRFSTTDVYSMQEWEDWFAQWNSKHRPGTKWTQTNPYTPRPKPDVIYVPRKIQRDAEPDPE